MSIGWALIRISEGLCILQASSERRVGINKLAASAADNVVDRTYSARIVSYKILA